jgi:hypothetical protein
MNKYGFNIENICQKARSFCNSEKSTGENK